MISVALALVSYLHLAEYHQEMEEFSRPLNKAGKSISRTFDTWSGKAEDYAGVGDEASESFMCSDPAFFVLRHKNETTDAGYWLLKGALRVPAANFATRFTMLGMRGPEAFMKLDVGQVVTPQYRNQPPQGPLQVMQKFTLPRGIGLIHIQVAGGQVDRSVQEIRCDITTPEMK